jgi:hypothetical protein
LNHLAEANQILCGPSDGRCFHQGEDSQGIHWLSRGLISGLVEDRPIKALALGALTAPALIPNAFPTPLNSPGRAPETSSGLSVAAQYVRIIRTLAKAAKKNLQSL